MSSRLLVVLVGAGVLLCPPLTPASPGSAALPPPRATVRPEAQALALLESASRAGRSLSYTGTQYAATWRGEDSGSALVEVAHDATRGSVVTAPRAPGDDPVPMTATLDPRLLDLLAASYDLVVAAPGRCTGRSTDVVEASRPDGTLAGRFWVDRDSGLLLRREVFDEQGGRIRSSAFLDVQVAGGDTAGGDTAGGDVPARDVPPGPASGAESVEQLRSAGWQVPAELPEGFRLFDTRLSSPSPGQQVLHLAYSDGLSTVSLFSQRGRLGTVPPAGFVAGQVGERPVWVRREVPERVVWGGEGRVWTLVSDAPPNAVMAVVGSLPRDRAPRGGVLARLGRGSARIAGMLDPFD